MDNSIAFISDKQDPKTMARNICSQCHRVLCSSGVSGSQPASHPCYTIYTTNSELEWPKKSVYISGVPAEGHRDLYTSRQLCRQRPPTHSWGGQRNLYTFQECQQRATKTCMHLGNYTTHTGKFSLMTKCEQPVKVGLTSLLHI